MSTEIERRRAKIKRRIEELRKKKDKIIAAAVDRVARNLEALIDARIMFLEWRLRTLGEREERTLESMAEKYKMFRKFYYLRLGYPEHEAEEKAEADTLMWKTKLRP